MSFYTCLPRDERLAQRWVNDDWQPTARDYGRALRQVKAHQPAVPRPPSRLRCAVCHDYWPCDTVEWATLTCRLWHALGPLGHRCFAIITKSGRILTDSDIDALSAEAERGYDLETISMVILEEGDRN